MADIINKELKTQQTLSTGINILDKKINGIRNGEVICMLEDQIWGNIV